MRRLALYTAVIALALGGCDGKKGKGGGSSGGAVGGRGGPTAEAVAKRYVAAAGKRDQAEAERCLMSEAQCKLVPADKRGQCPGYLKAVHDALPHYVQRVPKGFVPGEVKVDPKMPSGKPVTFYDVFPKGGGRPVSVVVGALGGRYYVNLPVKRKAVTQK